ncbi:chorismate--pyruvate lyase family protein [Marinagarivorans cellulosilyticus]|uniref:Chorismate--pyruvate lyase n=1 Tax=Marinagarivorans cellulosilyticus TaxID=2721545 RepID=A0AAN1WG07_9GAMM|nr:chorismate pyruvate-lyase family protein [Marinagarivorans cellulosilyticus]BCD96914.1 chorismate--pyruvate lyase [Marinagarivorans cellulosilyticus]
MTVKEQELFQVSGYAPDEGGVDWLQLPPFIRVLLSTDGTVTKTLEAYFWEPVDVTLCQQGEAPRAAIDEGFGVQLPATEKVWLREVALIGGQSGRHYVSALSLIRTTLLPEALRQGLEHGDLGIGGVIRELGLETYRKVIAVGCSDAAAMAWRAYRLYYQGQVVMSIREDFHLRAMQ